MGRQQRARGARGALMAAALPVFGRFAPGGSAAQAAADRLGQLPLGNDVVTLFHECRRR